MVVQSLSQPTLASFTPTKNKSSLWKKYQRSIFLTGALASLSLGALLYYLFSPSDMNKLYSLMPVKLDEPQSPILSSLFKKISQIIYNKIEDPFIDEELKLISCALIAVYGFKKIKKSQPSVLKSQPPVFYSILSAKNNAEIFRRVSNTPPHFPNPAVINSN